MVTSAPQQECREITPALLRLLQRLRWSAYWLDDPWSGSAYPDVHTNAYCDSDGYTYCYCNCYTDGNTYAYRHPHIHTDFNGDSNSYTYPDTETFTDAETGVNS